MIYHGISDRPVCPDYCANGVGEVHPGPISQREVDLDSESKKIHQREYFLQPSVSFGGSKACESRQRTTGRNRGDNRFMNNPVIVGRFWLALKKYCFPNRQ